MNEDRNNAAGAAASILSKKLKQKILLALAPVALYALLGLFALIAVIAIFQNFNSAFAVLTGGDPFATSSDYDTPNTGMDVANDVVASYNDPDKTTSVLDACDVSTSFTDWLSNVFLGTINNRCQLIAYIQESANDYEKDLDFKVDRGLIIGTFVYTYVNQSKDELVDEYGNVLDASDPLKILDLATSEVTDLKIKKDKIDELFDNQITTTNYISLTWGVVKSEVTSDPVYKDGKVVTLGTKTDYYGCITKSVTHKELDINKYNIYLRGGDDATGASNILPNGLTTPSLNVIKDGYIPAKTYQKVLENATGLCTAGSFTPSPETTDDYVVTKTLIESNGKEGSTTYVTMSSSQDFISKIVSENLNDYEKYLEAADPSTQQKDNLEIIDYKKGFIYDKFSLISENWHDTYSPKNIEKSVIDINTNAVHMNEALNYPSTDLFGVGSRNAGNNPVVVGDEAQLLGKFEYSVTSPFGMRIHPVEGGYKMHNGIDLSGYQIGGKEIYSWKPGKVSYAGYDSSCGYMVTIEHETLGEETDTFTTTYCHMQTKPFVSTGDKVVAGTLLGKVGTTGSSTGDHLHFGIRVNGVSKDPACIVTELKGHCKS